MIKFIICDDNKEALDIANKAVTKAMMNYEIEYKVLKFTKYDEKLKEQIKDEQNTKIYILDIELPIVSGLEIASEIRNTDDDSIIIFVTAHSECKNDIFYSRLEAIDYISKYYRYEERIEETIKYIMTKRYRKNTFEYTFNHVHNKLLYKEINYFEKELDQNKCIIHLVNNDTKYVSKTIQALSKELSPMFFQTHKSCLVNLDNIKYIDYKNYTIYFKNGDYTDFLSVEARKELRKIVGDYQGFDK